jgi:hypothetical protein
LIEFAEAAECGKVSTALPARRTLGASTEISRLAKLRAMRNIDREMRRKRPSAFRSAFNIAFGASGAKMRTRR